MICEHLKSGYKFTRSLKRSLKAKFEWENNERFLSWWQPRYAGGNFDYSWCLQLHSLFNTIYKRKAPIL